MVSEWGYGLRFVGFKVNVCVCVCVCVHARRGRGKMIPGSLLGYQLLGGNYLLLDHIYTYIDLTEHPFFFF